MSTYVDYDYDSDDDFYDVEGDYIWAEDSWELADELASGAIPDPPAAFYREDEYDDYDKYNFWSELEYGNGEIYDGEVAAEEGEGPVKAGDKRKRAKTTFLNDMIKRTKLAGIQEFPTVVWKPTRDSFSLRQECPMYKKPQKPYALLPDWRERFKNTPRFSATTTASSSEGALASEDQPEDQENGDWEDMSVEDDEEGGDMEDEEDMEGGVDLQDIDPNLLRSALAAKLSSSGLTGADQGAFMESLMQMMSGGGGQDTDDVLETLTSTLLNQATQGGNDSMAQWLSGQGVSLEDAEEGAEEDDSKGKTAPPTTSTDLSPQDSVAAEKPATKKAPAASPKSKATPKKRPSDTDMTGKKRKQVSFAASQEPVSSQAEPAALDPGPNSKRAKTTATDTPKTSVTAPVPAATKANSAKLKSKAGKTDASEAPPVNGTAKPTRSQAKNAKADEVVLKTEPFKQTRKRKAPGETSPEEKPKRQLRNFAAPTASSQSKVAETKTTRSGKARK